MSLTPDAIATAPPQSLDSADRTRKAHVVLQFDAIRAVEASGTNLEVNGESFLRLSDEMHASRDARWLKKLWKLPRKKRMDAIDGAFSRWLDRNQIREVFDAYDGFSKRVRIGSHLMFFLLFVTPAIAMVYPPIYLQWRLFLGLVLACLGWTAYSFFTAHRRLLPAYTAQRWKSLAILLLTPTAAIRACDALSRDVLSRYDPLMCTMVLCPEPIARQFARRVLQDLHYPLAHSLEPETRAIRDAFAARFQAALESPLADAGMNLSELLGPPAAEDPACLTYCPRCDQQYTVASGKCEDCGGLELMPCLCE